MTENINGSCLCEKVKFTIKNEFTVFYFCHCKQCQKLTGSAHASNIFTKPNNIHWLMGEENISRYDHPTRTFSKSFCSTCGSALPFLTQSGKYIIIPAGSLDDAVNISPQQNIFWDERADWHKSGASAKCTAQFPD